MKRILLIAAATCVLYALVFPQLALPCGTPPHPKTPAASTSRPNSGAVSVPAANWLACFAAKLSHPAGETRFERLARVLEACRP